MRFQKKVHQLILIQNPEASLRIAKEHTIEKMVRTHLSFFGISS